MDVDEEVHSRDKIGKPILRIAKCQVFMRERFGQKYQAHVNGGSDFFFFICDNILQAGRDYVLLVTHPVQPHTSYAHIIY